MCGISGVFTSKDIRGINFYNKFNDSLKHRGPDGSGKWFSEDNKLGIFHTRLSIQDLSIAGSQPMESSCKRFIISFNGEIYNHLEIRKLLNISWKGTSDTETLIEIVSKFGIDKSIKILRGMFAFCLYDKKLKKIFLCRDRFGEKPLYYGFLNNNFIFSSELKTLNFLKVEENIDLLSLNAYFNYMYIPEDRSIFKNFKKLKPGCYLSLSLSNLSTKSIDIINWYPKPEKSKKYEFDSNENYEIELEKKLKNSVSNMLISDRPIGAFLSGGTDSSLICSILSKIKKTKLKTFTIGFHNKKFDESTYAKKVASYLNVDHYEHIFSDSDILNLIPKISNIYDEPFADSSQIPSYLISSITKNLDIDVALTGDGGDELFGGYNRYFLTLKYWPYLKKIPYNLRLLISNIAISSGFSNLNPKLNKIFRKIVKLKNFDDLYFNLTTELNYLNRILKKDFHLEIEKKKFENNTDLNDQVNEMMQKDINSYLPDDILCKVDRASMANSLETRAPFLDHEIFEYASKIPMKLKVTNKESKIILKNILEKYLPKNLIYREKMGFGIPLREFLLEKSRNWSRSIIFDEFYKDVFIDQDILEKIWFDTDKKKFDHSNIIWSAIVFRSWFKNKV